MKLLNNLYEIVYRNKPAYKLIKNITGIFKLIEIISNINNEMVIYLVDIEIIL